MAEIDVRRAASRFVGCSDGRESRYSFSYAEHYDAANIHHGLLLAHNDETLAPGAGYAEHHHRHLEILTWVLAGQLTHRDSTGATHAVAAGWVQLMSAGRGVSHSETNEQSEPVRYLQMWVVPDGRRTEPGYDLMRLPPGTVTPPIQPVGQPDARFVVGRPDRTGIVLPDAAFLHLFVATGAVAVDGVGRLRQGDAVRFSDTGERRVTGSAGSQVGIWVMESALGG